MANRRMMSKTVIETDDFIEMSLQAQALYFHFLLKADDDGFVGNPKSIMRLINSSDKDLQELIEKGFVIRFENGVLVIRHWNVHNYIQPDRYNATVYQDFLSQLVDKDKVYYLQGDKRIQGVSITDTQDRIGQLDEDRDREGKDREGKINIEQTSAPLQEELALININISDYQYLLTAYEEVTIKRYLDKMYSYLKSGGKPYRNPYETLKEMMNEDCKKGKIKRKYSPLK